MPDLVTSILGLATSAEGMVDLVAWAYLRRVPDEIGPILIKPFPLRGADQVRLLRAVIARERYDDLRDLPDAFDRLQRTRNDLAHSQLVPVDLFHPVDYRLLNHRERPLDVLPAILTVEILLAEMNRAADLREGPMSALIYRLGMLRFKHPEGKPLGIPETGPGPRPVIRNDDE